MNFRNPLSSMGNFFSKPKPTVGQTETDGFIEYDLITAIPYPGTEIEVNENGGIKTGLVQRNDDIPQGPKNFAVKYEDESVRIFNDEKDTNKGILIKIGDIKEHYRGGRKRTHRKRTHRKRTHRKRTHRKRTHKRA